MPRTLNNEVDVLNIASQDNDIRDTFTREMISDDQEDLTVASRAYDVHEIFIGSDRYLYQALTTIAEGATITPGTNVKIVHISDLLYQLFSQSPVYIQEIISNIETSDKATRNYSKDQQFIWTDGELYTCTTAISLGTTLTVGTNIAASANITEQIKALDNRFYLPSDTAETTIADDDYFTFYDTSASAKRKTLFSKIVDKLKNVFPVKTNLTDGSVTKVGTATVGGSYTPMYLNAGAPTSGSECAPKSHASTATTYGGATASNYGHSKLSDNYTSSAGTAAQSIGASSLAIYNSYANRAPISHASTATTYGVGNANNYGHVKLSDTYNSSVGAAANAIGASQAALYNAYAWANNNFTKLTTFDFNGANVANVTPTTSYKVFNTGCSITANVCWVYLNLVTHGSWDSQNRSTTYDIVLERSFNNSTWEEVGGAKYLCVPANTTIHSYDLIFFTWGDTTKKMYLRAKVRTNTNTQGPAVSNFNNASQMFAFKRDIF